MAKEDNKSQQFLSYYSFWIYQYSKRNREFQEKYKNQRLKLSKYNAIRKDLDHYRKRLGKALRPGRTGGFVQSDEVIEIMKQLESKLIEFDGNLSVDKFIAEVNSVVTKGDYSYRPCINQEVAQLSSDQIINIITEKGEVSQHCFLDYPDELLYSSVNYNYDWATIKESSSVNERFVHLYIDTDCDIEVVLKETQSAYFDKRSNRFALDAAQRKASDLTVASEPEAASNDPTRHFTPYALEWIKRNEEIKNELKYLKIRRIIKNRGRGFDLDDTPRAIGLWLWDYITNHYGECEPPHKAHADARKIFKENFDYIKLGYQETESGTYRNWYHRTAACIEACDVLSFKGDGRKKKTKD